MTITPKRVSSDKRQLGPSVAQTALLFFFLSFLPTMASEVSGSKKRIVPTYSWEDDHSVICENYLSQKPLEGNIVTNNVRHLPDIYKWASDTKSRPLVLVDRSGKSDIGLLALENHPRVLTIAYAVASDTKSLNAIHEGEDLGLSGLMTSKGFASAFKEWQKQYAASRFLNLAPNRENEQGEARGDGKSETMKSSLMKTVSTMDADDLLVVLAHNIDGQLRFGDGSTCKQAELQSGKGKVWILSCGTFKGLGREPGLSVGTIDTLSYEQAMGAVRRTLEASVLDEVTFRDILFSVTNGQELSSPKESEPQANATSAKDQIFAVVENNVTDFKSVQNA